MNGAIDAAHFRQVLGQYPTGVVVVTALATDGEPLGMTVGSFTSVSLDPPLVAFMPDRNSNSWRAIRESGDSFCVNVLSAAQEGICRAVATRKSNKFDGISWARSGSGNPVIEAAVAYIDCSLKDIYEAGDHNIVIGEIRDLEVQKTAYPLLFFRGGYGSFVPLSLAASDADLLDQLRLVDLARPSMESLADRFDSEVTAIALVRDELVLAAAAGHAKSAVTPTRVGQRMPFVPPLGSVFAAWGGDEVLERWIARLDDPTHDAARAEEYRAVVERVRERGCAIVIGHEPSAHFEEMSARVNLGDPEVSESMLKDAIRHVANCYNPERLMDGTKHELRLITAPVFNPRNEIAFTLSLWGPPGEISSDRVDAHIGCLLESAQEATFRIGRAAM